MNIRHNQFIPAFVLLAVFSSCAVSEQSRYGISYSIQLGANKGGITENTDLSIVPNAKPTAEATIDAYTGATYTRFNLGSHFRKSLNYGEIETGLDYMLNYQEFSYADQGNAYFGVREFTVNQFMMPLTFNIPILNKLLPTAQIKLKMGYVGQLNLVSVNSFGILPGYSINRWSSGGLLSLSAYPIRFNNSSRLGFYMDIFRGTQIYEDYYNLPEYEMPGSSFLSYGISYQFK